MSSKNESERVVDAVKLGSSEDSQIDDISSKFRVEQKVVERSRVCRSVVELSSVSR